MIETLLFDSLVRAVQEVLDQQLHCDLVLLDEFQADLWSDGSFVSWIATKWLVLGKNRSEAPIVSRENGGHWVSITGCLRQEWGRVQVSWPARLHSREVINYICPSLHAVSSPKQFFLRNCFCQNLPRRGSHTVLGSSGSKLRSLCAMWRRNRLVWRIGILENQSFGSVC